MKRAIFALIVILSGAALVKPAFLFAAEDIGERLGGKILLQVEENGEAWYVNPSTGERHYLARPSNAFDVMREQGVGISNADLAKIPIGLSSLSGVDSDSDGLSDAFEDAIGTDKDNSDTDGDGYSDNTEVENGFNPTGIGRPAFDSAFTALQLGRIFLQVESHGEAWWINPDDGLRYFLSRPTDAFTIMQSFGLGISNVDIAQILEPSVVEDVMEAMEPVVEDVMEAMEPVVEDVMEPPMELR